jgi:hypothetical protein
MATQFISIINVDGKKPRIDQRVFGCYKDVNDERVKALTLFKDEEDPKNKITQRVVVKSDDKVQCDATIDEEGVITLKEGFTQCLQCQYKPAGDIYDEDGSCLKCGIQVTVQ